MQTKLKKLEEKMKAYAKVGDIERNLNRVIMGLKKNLKEKETEVEGVKKELKELRESNREGSHHEDRPKVPSAPKHRPEPKELRPPPLVMNIQHGTPQNHCSNCTKTKQ